MAVYLFKVIIILLIVFCLGNKEILARKDYQRFVSVVYPIRGDEYWQSKDTNYVQNARSLYDLTQTHEVLATWLIRFDAMNSDIQTILDNKNNDIGIFLEITQNLASKSDVAYPKGEDWFHPQRIFLSGYSFEDRVKLIDTMMNEFLKTFGRYPSTVGAWHVDAYSAKYLHERYGVFAIILCSDQYSTDRYQLWGSWWGVPYIPSKVNLLIPATTEEYRLPVLIGQWASRDPGLGYGSGVHDSTFSVQANDYMLKGFGIEYFKKLASTYLDNEDNQFGFLQIGIENDYDLRLYLPELSKQISALKSMEDVLFLTYKDFASWYLERFRFSPNHEIKSRDDTVIASWKMSTLERVGLINENQIRDLRLYDETFPESFLKNRNPFSVLSAVYPAKVDNVAGYEIKNNDYGQWLNSWPSWNWNRFLPMIIGSLLIIILNYRNKLISFIIVFGSWIWMIPMVRSGVMMDYGMGFWGAHGHDAIWHLSIIENLSNKLSLDNPMMIGTKLSNYHFGSDIIQLVIHKLTGIDNLTLYFIYIPFLIATSLGLLIVAVFKQLKLTKVSVLWALFLTYSGSGLGWLFELYRNGVFGGETMFWAQQPVSSLINPPFAWSLVLLMSAIYFLNLFLKNSTWKLLIATSLTIGLMGPTKLYLAILVLGSLAVLSVAELVQHIKSNLSFSINKIIQLFPISCVLTISTIINGLLLLPVIDLSSSSSFIFSPGWFLASMVQNQDRFYWLQMANALQAYQATNNILKYSLAIGLLFVIWLIGNFGIRIVGLFNLVFLSKTFKDNQISQKIFQLLNLILLLGIIIATLFVQKGTNWNTIQFVYYSMFIAGLFTAIILGNVKINSIKGLVIGSTVILANLPIILGTYPHYLPERAPARIPAEEIHALRYLKSLDQGNILTYPFSSDNKNIYDEPLPLRVYESTAYVSAFSAKPVVLEDEVNQEITSKNWQVRKSEILSFFENDNLDESKNFISKYNIKYIYLYKDQPDPKFLTNLNSRIIYNSGLVRILEIYL